jgi:hypothetical protein
LSFGAAGERQHCVDVEIDMKPQSQQRQPGLEQEMEPLPEFMPRTGGSRRTAGKVALITGDDSGICGGF